MELRHDTEGLTEEFVKVFVAALAAAVRLGGIDADAMVQVGAVADVTLLNSVEKSFE